MDADRQLLLDLPGVSFSRNETCACGALVVRVWPAHSTRSWVRDAATWELHGKRCPAQRAIREAEGVLREARGREGERRRFYRDMGLVP